MVNYIQQSVSGSVSFNENTSNEKRKQKQKQTVSKKKTGTKKRPSAAPTSANRKKKYKKSANPKRSNPKKRRTKQQRLRKKIVSTIFDMLFFLFILLMLGGATLFSISENNNKSFYGYRFYEVYTNSMKKTKDGQKGNFVAGDMVIIRVEDPDKISVGDIITFVPNKQSPDTYLTHRVIAKEEPEKLESTNTYPIFTTQGDANNLADPPVTGDRVVGVVKLVIPKAGTGLRFIKNNMIPVGVIVVSFFLLIILLRQYFTPDKKRKRKKTQKRKNKNKK